MHMSYPHKSLKFPLRQKSVSFSSKQFRQNVPTAVISNYDSSTFQKQHRLSCSAICPRRAKLTVVTIVVDVLSIVFELIGTYSDVLHSHHAVTTHTCITWQEVPFEKARFADKSHNILRTSSREQASKFSAIAFQCRQHWTFICP